MESLKYHWDDVADNKKKKEKSLVHCFVDLGDNMYLYIALYKKVIFITSGRMLVKWEMK